MAGPTRRTEPGRVVGPGFVGFEPHSRWRTPTRSRDLLAARRRALAGVAVGVCPMTSASSVADDVELARRSLGAFNAVLAEIGARGLCDLRYGTATATWFERRHGRGRVSVAREIRAGKKLRSDLGVLHAAAMRGGDHLRALVAFIASKSMPATSTRSPQPRTPYWPVGRRAVLDNVLRWCPTWPATPMPTAVRPRRHEPGPREQGGRRRRDRRRVRRRLGATFNSFVEAATDRLWRQHRRDQQSCPDLPVPPTRVELRALALLELVRRLVPPPIPVRPRPVTELGLVIDADHIDELDPRLADILNTGRPAREQSRAGVR